MNSTIVLSHYGVVTHLDSLLRLHIIISLLVSGGFLPLIYILKRRQHALLTSLEIISAAAIGIGILFGILARDHYHSRSHSLLGYLILTIFEIYLVLDLWRQRQRYRAKSEPALVRRSQLRFLQLIERLIPFILYVEIVLGAVAVLGLCGAPFTQQCFGHIGIGSLFLVYFSFWAALIILEEQNKILWRPEVLDAIFIIPGGLGLALFGHVRFISNSPAVSPVNLEEAWGYPWDNESLQHVLLGILSLIGAILGAVLSKYPPGCSKRNILPGMVAAIAGYSFIVHPQKDNNIVGSLHLGLGFLIVGIGVTRVLDVASVYYIQDKKEKGNGISGPWNFLASFLGITAGLFIIVANEEQSRMLMDMGVDSGSVFMELLAVGMGILGYVCVIAAFLRTERRADYTRIEMDDFGGQ